MEYTAVIRTLGKSGYCFQQTLDSLMRQTVRPAAIFVYIAEGYPLPKETVGCEQYIYVKKGMVAQRALPYDEVRTEYMFFLDDDVLLPPHAVETLYREMSARQAQVISPCVFANHAAPAASKLRASMLGREVCRLWGKRWAYKVLRTGGFSYRNRPTEAAYESQTNAGPCFFCAKADFLRIRFEEERWLDDTPYAFPDDQVMFYKMYKLGLRQLTSFDSGIVHLDASSTVSNTHEKTLKVIYSEYRNKLIFWHRFIYTTEKNVLLKGWAVLAIAYSYGLQALKYVLRWLAGHRSDFQAYRKGLADGWRFIHGSNYARIPKIGSARR